MTSALSSARRVVDAIRISEREKRKLARENAALRARVAELERQQAPAQIPDTTETRTQ